MKPKLFSLLLFLIMLSPFLLGCGTKSQKQTTKKTIHYRERLDSIKSTHKDEDYVLFEKFDQKDSYIIYATRTGIYKETVWGETSTLLEDSESDSFSLKSVKVKKWSAPPSDTGLYTPFLEWDDYVLEDEPGEGVFRISGGLICAIKEGATAYPWKIVCNEAGVLIDGCLFLYEDPKVFYESSKIKANGDSDFYKFKGVAKINILDMPGLPSEVYSYMRDNSLAYSNCAYIEWPFKIAPSGNIDQNYEDFLYEGKTCSTFLKERFCEKIHKAVENERQNQIEKILDSSMKLYEFTEAYQKNPIKAEQRYPVGSRVRLNVDVESISRSENPYYRYMLRATSGIVDAYSYIYTDDESFATKDYPIGCCMEATFSHFNGGQLFEFVNAESIIFGPTSYQNDYDY